MSVCAAPAAALSDEFDEDSRIRTRLEACRMGMQQLEAMRSKHTKLMENIRSYYPTAAAEEMKVVARVKKPRESLMSPRNVASFITNERYEDLLRCESPVQCYSHRSSVSIDSGCASITSEQLNSSTTSFGTLRKASIDESASLAEVDPHHQNDDNSMTHMIATAIASTTAVRPSRRYVKNWQRERPRSMYASVPDDAEPSYLDTHSFSQITPPPTQRKFATVSRTESFHQTPLHRRSLSNLVSPECARVTPMPKSPEAPPKTTAGVTVAASKPLSLSSPRPLPRTVPQPPPRNSLKPQAQSPPSVYHTARVYVQQQRPVITKARDTVTPTFIAHPALVVSRSQSSGSSTDSSPVSIRRTYVVQPIRRNEVKSPKTEKRWFESESL
ncbi:hypothetical protein QR680_007431 [Steinernema hermaphroditum]|uniref:Uncharacterized protein n=1 Tax=Steinernema hermaphroditum TaxID=289476 RepID=A0AA39M5D3_9BILA|nr:hypothetical protein QR680_007431 [Steinernema hermaphroditum]